MSFMDWDRLSQAIIDRRTSLGYRKREPFAHAAELSSRLLADLEHNRRQNYDRVTISRVEQALEWDPGTINRILRGLPYPGMPTEVVDLSAELMTFEGLVGNLHRLDPGILAALLHRSGVGPEGRWRAVQALRALAVDQLRANWQRLAEVIVAEGGTVDVSTWPGWLEAPQMVEDLRKDQP